MDSLIKNTEKLKSLKHFDIDRYSSVQYLIEESLLLGNRFYSYYLIKSQNIKIEHRIVLHFGDRNDIYTLTVSICSTRLKGYSKSWVLAIIAKDFFIGIRAQNKNELQKLTDLFYSFNRHDGIEFINIIDEFIKSNCFVDDNQNYNSILTFKVGESKND